MSRKTTKRFDLTRDEQGPRGRRCPRRQTSRHAVIRAALQEA